MDLPDDAEYEVTSIPLTTLYRWFMYDVNVQNPNDHIDIFQISPVSEEGDEKEREDSIKRLQPIKSLIPLIKLYASMNAKYTVEMQQKDLFNNHGLAADKIKNEKETLEIIYERLTFFGLVTMLASAVELGLLFVDNVNITESDEE